MTCAIPKPVRQAPSLIPNRSRLADRSPLPKFVRSFARTPTERTPVEGSPRGYTGGHRSRGLAAGSVWRDDQCRLARRCDAAPPPKEPGQGRLRRNIRDLNLRELSFSGQLMTAAQIARAIEAARTAVAPHGRCRTPARGISTSNRFPVGVRVDLSRLEWGGLMCPRQRSGGTSGSNPVPSSGESRANLTRSIRAVEKGEPARLAGARSSAVLGGSDAAVLRRLAAENFNDRD